MCKELIIKLNHLLFYRMYEGGFCEITTVCEAQYREEILQETLKQVQARKVSYRVNYSRSLNLCETLCFLVYFKKRKSFFLYLKIILTL